MTGRLALLAFALLSAVVTICIVLLSVEAKGATVHRYRRPYAVLVGLSPTDAEVYKCHNRNFSDPHVYIFGGCKEITKG